MKKFYLSFLIAAFAVLVSNSVSAQGLTVTSYEGTTWPWETWGDVAQGDTLRVQGSYTATVTENDTTFEVMKVQITIMHLDQSSWAGIHNYTAVITDTAFGDLSTGTIDHLITIPANFPLSSTAPDDWWLLQTRVYYGYDGEIVHRGTNPVDGEASILDQWANMHITIVEGTQEVDPGLNVTSYQGKDWPWETWGDVMQGEVVNVDGTFSQSVTENDTVFDVMKVQLSLLHLDQSSWATVDAYDEVIFESLGNDEYLGDVASSTIKHGITIPEDFPLSETAPDDWWLLQTRVYYGYDGEIVHRGTNPVDGEASILDQWANMHITIIADPGTSVKNILVKDGIKVYPNPVKAGEQLRISTNYFEGDVKVSVINSVGAQAYFSIRSANDLNIDTNGFAPGMYNVIVGTDEQVSVQKFIVAQ